MRAIGVIPARWGSTRFPGKPLAPIAGVPLVERVYRRAVGARHLDAVYVATDDARIAEACAGFGAPVRMTRSDHATGTDRIAEAIGELEAGIVVNIQGDEPLVDPAALDDLVERLQRDAQADIATLAHPANADALDDPNRVKVVTTVTGDALYFSRSPIPHPRDAPVAPLQHVGVYAFRRSALTRFVQLPQTPAERAEGLEQLRALQHGMRIVVVTVHSWVAAAVDVPADVARVEAILARQPPRND